MTKKFGAIAVILLAVCALQACHHNTAFINTDDDSSSSPVDTEKMANLVVDKADSDFAVSAANNNNTEIELGKLAIKNGKSKKVKNYGLMMIKDRGKANIKLMALSRAKKLNLPLTLDTPAQHLFSGLSEKNGDAFDKAYISTVITNHKDAVKKFTDATQQVQDPDLKKYAIKTLPVLRKHLDAINAIYDSMAQ
jgi:putative membrane protein